MKQYLLPFAAAAAMVFGVAPAAAGEAEDGKLSEQAQREVLESIEQRIRADLYDEAIASTYLAALQAFRDRRDFGAPVSSDLFALSVHRALHRAKLDFHLGIYGPAMIELDDTQADGDGDHDEEFDDEHHGDDGDQRKSISVIAEEDAITLIKISAFDSAQDSILEMYAALATVEDARGVIFDLRGNMGGDAKLARLMLGCLLEDATDLYTIEIPRGEHKRLSRYLSEADARCAPVSDKPVAVLVDHNTASTAELFPFILQNRGRAAIIGEPTLGGAHAAEYFQLAHGFGMIMPIGYVRDNLTGADWEGDGVTPDIIVRPVAARMRAVEAINQLIVCEDLRKKTKGAFGGFSCTVSE